MTIDSRRMQHRRRPWGRVAIILTAAALVAVIGITYGLRGPQPPAAEFGALPPPGAGLGPALGGAGGPGFTFELEYALSGELLTALPGFAEQGPAYRRLPLQFDEDWVASIAVKLGITAPVEREGWQEGYLLAADPGEGQPSLRMYPSGYITYTQQDYDYRPVERGELPEDIRAVAAAREWLVSSGLVSAGELGEATVTPDLETGRLFVRFRPLEPDDVVTLAPWAQVEMGVAETVITGSAVWFGVDAQSTYALRPVEEAWQEVQAGEGTLWWEITEFPGPSADEDVVRGTAQITGTRLAWALALGADDTPYLVPVYAFTGSLEVRGEEGPVDLPVLVWTAAAGDQYRSR